MKKYISLATALLVAGIFTGCDLVDNLLGKNNKAQQNTGQPAQQIVSVDAMVAKKADNKMNFEYPTKLESPQDVIITPKVSGTLLKQNFKAGDKVKTGDILFIIEPDMFEASYEVANASILSAEAALKSATSEFERIKKLYSQKSVSQKEYDNALANYESARAAIASAKANAKTAKLNLSYTKVIAPFDGVVGENLNDVGSYIIAGQTQLVRLSKINPVEARYYIADSANLKRLDNLAQKSWEQLNSEATLNVDGYEFKGKVTFIDNLVDVNTGSVLAKAEFKNEDGMLLPGTFGKLIMVGFVQKNSFLIPQIAIKQDAVSAYVLVAKDGKVAKKQVKIVYQTSSNAIVTDGLDDGDIIILNNFNKIGVGAGVKAEFKENN